MAFAKELHKDNIHCICISIIFLIIAASLNACDPVLGPCCFDYIYYYDDTGHTEDAFEQMCLNAMTYDKKYDLNYDCKLREVDKYVDAALACCEPLKDEIKTSLFDDVVSHPSEWTASDAELMLPLLNHSFNNRASDKYSPDSIYNYDPYSDAHNMIWGGNYGNSGAYQYKLPENAYTWCLLNTNPNTYQCDLNGARAFERNLRKCCGGDNGSCLAAYVKNSGQCIDGE